MRAKTTTAKLFLLPILFSFSSCFVHLGVLTKRYTKVELKDASLQTMVDVYGLSQPIILEVKQTSPGKTAFDFSPQGQAALIKAYAAAGAKIDTIIEGLKKTLSSENESKTETFIDLSKCSKTIILTVKKNMTLNDADRVTKFDIALESDNSQVHFIGCDKFSTLYATADLGNLKYQDQRSATLTGSLGNSIAIGSSGQNVSGTNNSQTNDINNSATNSVLNGTTDANGAYTSSNSSTNGTTNQTTTGSNNSQSNTTGSTRQTSFNTGVSGQLSASKSFSEEVNLRQRYINLSAYMKGEELHFYQEGVSGIDVSGNISAIIKVQFDEGLLKDVTFFNFDNLFKSGLLVPPQDVKANSATVLFPAFSDDVKIKMCYEGVLRKVNKGDKTISEADDHVILYHGEGESKTNCTLFKKNELTPKAWGLLMPSGLPLAIKGSNSASYSGTLYFSSYDAAASFLNWLKQSGNIIITANNTIGKNKDTHTFYLSNQVLDLDAINSLQVKFIAAEAL